jgi:hypothetical protein
MLGGVQRRQYLFPQGARLGRDNLVLHAVGRRHKVTGFPGPLSIKTVLRGQVAWIVAGRQIARVPAAKPSTRQELFRRLEAGREFLHARVEGPASLGRRRAGGLPLAVSLPSRLYPGVPANPACLPHPSPPGGAPPSAEIRKIRTA